MATKSKPIEETGDLSLKEMARTCPVCKKNKPLPNDTFYPPAELYKHLMSRAHSKGDLADLIQEEATANDLFV